MCSTGDLHSQHRAETCQWDGNLWDGKAGGFGLSMVRSGSRPAEAPSRFNDAPRHARHNIARTAGSGFEQVLKTTVYVASSDRAQLVRAWRVVEESFAPSRPPSTLLGVASLAMPEMLVEIECEAIIEPERLRVPGKN